MKDLKEMTVQELSEYLAWTIEVEEDESYYKLESDMYCELIRRAKLVESPQWKLTQILLELEEAGLPEPLKIDYRIESDLRCSIYFNNINNNTIFDLSFYIKKTSKEVDFALYDCNGERLSCDSENLFESNLPEAIEKLKEILK